MLDSVAPMWEKLKIHHSMISANFSEEFLNKTFASRKTDLIKKSKPGKLRVDLARSKENGAYVGYCISTINKDNAGEVDSIFVEEKFRAKAIGEKLVKKALKWMDDEKVKSKIIMVASGNEGVLPFYEKFGFLPRFIMLKQK